MGKQYKKYEREEQRYVETPHTGPGAGAPGSLVCWSADGGEEG